MLHSDQVLREKIDGFLRRKQAKYPELTSTERGEQEHEHFKARVPYRGLHFVPTK